MHFDGKGKQKIKTTKEIREINVVGIVGLWTYKV